MCPCGENGGRAADGWIRVLTQRLANRVSQARQAQQTVHDNPRLELGASTGSWLQTAQLKASAIRIGCCVQHACCQTFQLLARD
jgi:hypothetical protein